MPNPTARLTYKEFLSVWKNLDECPACHKFNGFVVKELPNGDAQFNCFTPDCGAAAIAKAIRQRVSNKPRPTGLTVEQYANAKKLPAAWLRSVFGLKDTTYQGLPAVEFPSGVGAPGAFTKYRIGMGPSDHRRKKDTKTMLYGLSQLGDLLKDAHEDGFSVDFCFIVEGESNTQTLLLNSVPAVGVPGAGTWHEEYGKHPFFEGRKIFVIQDPDKGGEQLAADIVKSFPAGSVRIVKLAVKDVSGLWLAHVGDNMLELADMWLDEAREKFVADLSKAVSESTADVQSSDECWTIQTFSAADVKPKIIRWLWEDRIPLAKFTLFYGLPDQGKSTVTRDIIARATRGDDFPDRKNAHGPMDVLVMAAEDDIADTVVPGLMAAKTDLNRVKFAKLTKFVGKVPQKDRKIALDKDLAAVERFLAQNPSIRLLVIDPISSYLGDLNRNKDKDIRALLDDVKELAERVGIAIIAISHFNKNSDQASIHRISGAGAWGEVPRAIWAFVPAPADEDGQPSEEHLMLNAKLNIASKAKSTGLKYQFVDVPLEIEGETTVKARIQWGGASTTSLDDVLQEEKGRPGPEAVKTKAAVEWLRGYLVESKLSDDVIADGKAAGHSKPTLYKAKDELGLKAHRPGGNKGPWYWPAVEQDELGDSGI